MTLTMSGSYNYINCDAGVSNRIILKYNYLIWSSGLTIWIELFQNISEIVENS